jgi:hypothetical protein
MVKLSDEELQQKISEQLPGQQMIRRESAAVSSGMDTSDYTQRRASADAVTPDVETLKRKYLGASFGAPTASMPMTGARPETADVSAEPETEFVVTTPTVDTEFDTFDPGPGPKAHLIDENGNIIGQQG